VTLVIDPSRVYIFTPQIMMGRKLRLIEDTYKEGNGYQH
jgi:hypothetical protein